MEKNKKYSKVMLAIMDRKRLHPDWEDINFDEIKKIFKVDYLTKEEKLVCLATCKNTSEAIKSVRRMHYEMFCFDDLLAEESVLLDHTKEQAEEHKEKAKKEQYIQLYNLKGDKNEK